MFYWNFVFGGDIFDYNGVENGVDVGIDCGVDVEEEVIFVKEYVLK